MKTKQPKTKMNVRLLRRIERQIMACRMTPELQRVCIADACGKYTERRVLWKSAWVGIPDYLADLNAMHEAEKVLTKIQWEVYLQRIWSVCRSTSEDFVIAHATAAQRAEAFLRTIGKWKD